MILNRSGFGDGSLCFPALISDEVWVFFFVQQ
jgi:hypothetical protein